MTELTTDEKTIHVNIAEKLLYPLWLCMDNDYKRKYKNNIWEQFENNIRSAAYTQRLPVFIEKITNLMGISIQTRFLKDINSIMSLEQDAEILTLLRKETTYLVILVSLQHQNKKDVYAEAKEMNDMPIIPIPDHIKDWIDTPNSESTK